MKVREIYTMPASTTSGAPCYVAYSDTAQVCRVARTREEAIRLCMASIAVQEGASSAVAFDFGTQEQPTTPTTPTPTTASKQPRFAPSAN